MKFITASLVVFASLIGHPSFAVYVDSTYIYTTFHSPDSTHLFLVSQVVVGQKPCTLSSVYVADSANTTVATLCYTGGVITESCPRTDTVDLGIKKNGALNIVAVFREKTNSQCRASFFYKDTFEFIVNAGYTDLNEINFSHGGLSFYPNPTTGKLSCTVSNATQNATIQILSIEGKVMLQNIPATQPNFEIDVSALPAGLYFLQWQNDKQRVVKKFVKE